MKFQMHVLTGALIVGFYNSGAQNNNASLKLRTACTLVSLVYTYFIATNYSNGVGSQVLATLVTTLPLHIQINQSM